VRTQGQQRGRPCPRGRTMSARMRVRPRGRECFIPGKFKKDATVRPSHGRPRGHRPTVCPSVRPKMSAWQPWVHWAFHSWDLYQSAISTDAFAGALAVLKIYKHCSGFLHFYGTFISELYIEFLSTFVVFNRFNTNGQVHPSLDKILDWSIVSWILISGLTL
jgi:hypothetical protein